MTTTFTFIRHAENNDLIHGIFCSTSPDDALTPEGIVQAEQTGDYLAAQGVDVLMSSPLKRAVDTAHIIAEKTSLKPVLMDNFSEIDTGALNNERSTDRIWQDWERVTKAWQEGRIKTPFPGGETYMEVWARFREGIEQCIAGYNGGHIAIITHGGLLTNTLKDLCPGSNVEWYRRFPIPNCARIEASVEMKKIRYGDPKPTGKITAWAKVSHLAG